MSLTDTYNHCLFFIIRIEPALKIKISKLYLQKSRVYLFQLNRRITYISTVHIVPLIEYRLKYKVYYELKLQKKQLKIKV